MGFRILFFLAVLFIIIGSDVRAQDLFYSENPRLGIGAMAGLAYDPLDARDFLALNALLLFDYDRVWGHKAPENLKFKAEFSVGSTTEPEDLILSSGIAALLYLDQFETKWFRPYVEAGIGIIYTDYKVDGQGLNLNFNPRAGVGTDIKIKGDASFYCGLSLWHLSNGNIDSDNRGSNAVVLLFGRYFDLAGF